MTAITRGPALEAFLAARSDLSGRAVPRAGIVRCHELTNLLDAAIRELVGPSSSFAAVAVGGYGRREQSRHSDVDIMVLMAQHDDGSAMRSLYPLWDAGLKVGHSVRTIDQAIEAMLSSVETFTALLDTRLVAGPVDLHEQLRSAIRRAAKRHRAALFDGLRERRRALRERQPWQLLAVDLKNGRGGLRDLQSVHWLDTVDALIGGDERNAASSAASSAVHERLLATRAAVHALNERPSDQFRPDLQHAVGEWLGVDGFDWARAVYAAMREADAAADARLQIQPPRRRWFARGAGRLTVPPSTASDAAFLRPIEQLRAALEVIEPGGSLDPFPRTAWLTALLPEWEVLRARPHVAEFHIHPVDVHASRAVAEARRVMTEDEFETGTIAVAAELGRPDEVLLAALLHDIGKGHGGDHSSGGAVIAERFASRAGLPPDEAVRLVSAVRLHLLLPNVATRRDIADREVIADTAARIGDANTLRLLYLVSIADARASGPNVWSQWKAQLMRALYTRVLGVLNEEAPDAALPRVDAIVEALAGRCAPEAVREHLARMSGDYLISTPATVIGDHIALIEEARGGTAARRDHLGDIDRLTVVTPDRPGILQAVAGTLAGHNANVLGGVAHTRADGVAIQVWHVSDALGVGIDERRWGRILEAIPAALDGRFDIGERLAEVRRLYPEQRRGDVPTTVQVDNAASREYSVLEISTGDRRGLLYDLTRDLHEQGIDIHLAKVDTIGPEIVDAFYIRRENGRRIDDPDEVERLVQRVRGVIAALDAPP